MTNLANFNFLHFNEKKCEFPDKRSKPELDPDQSSFIRICGSESASKLYGSETVVLTIGSDAHIISGNPELVH